MTGVLSAPMVNAITITVLIGASVGCVILAAACAICGEQARRDHDARALAIVCDPCNDVPGRCTCSGKCSHPMCGADDTGVDEFGRELHAWLDREGP